MGTYNSSRYRVRPVFDALRKQDSSGRTWLSPLLILPRRHGRSPLAVVPEVIGTIEEAAWGSEVPEAPRGRAANTTSPTMPARMPSRASATIPRVLSSTGFPIGIADAVAHPGRVPPTPTSFEQRRTSHVRSAPTRLRSWLLLRALA